MFIETLDLYLKLVSSQKIDSNKLSTKGSEYSSSPDRVPEAFYDVVVLDNDNLRRLRSMQEPCNKSKRWLGAIDPSLKRRI